MNKPKNNVDVSQLIGRAKSTIILDHPFFASLLLSMSVMEDSSIPTAATDGDSIMYNPEWVSTLNADQVVFLFAHEVMHVVFEHMCRRGEREPNKWNQACDYIINQLLVDEKVGEFIPIGLLNQKLVESGGGTAEGVYALLPDSASKKNPGDQGGSLDDCRDAGSNPQADADGNPIPGTGGGVPDEATLARKRADIKVRVNQARNAAKMQGNLSAGIDRLVSKLVKPRTDWRAQLRRFMTEKIKEYYSYARPNRRWLGEDINLPTKTGERLGLIAVAIDCSGSISDELLNLFSSEINAIAEDAQPKELKASYFDAVVLRVDSHTEYPIQLKPVGGGGTCFEPIFENIETWEEQPICLIVLTDMYGSFPDSAPDYPVMWASISEDETAPFGEVIHVRASDEE